jgi:hypothetical protein
VEKVERIGLMVVSVILALVVAAPMAFAESQGGAPKDASGTIVVNPGDYPGTCGFAYSLEFSGKGKMIELPSGGIILTSPGLDVTITNLEEPENQATFNITGSVHQSTLENGNVETVMTGRNFAIDPVVGTTVVIGRYTFVFDAEGNLVQHQMGTGQRIDVCELLS